MRESKEPIANLDMSSFIRYRRLQMPRMGNANAKKTRDQQRDIFERFFPSRPRESGVSSAEKPQSRDKDSTSLNSDDSGQGGLSSSEKDSLLDGMRTSTFSSCSEGNNSNSENESDFLSRDTRLNRSRDDLDSICSEMRINDRTRDCLLQSHRGPRPHSTPPPRTNFVGKIGDENVGTNCDPGHKHDHSKGTSKVVGSRSRKIGVGSKLTSGHKYRYKDKTNHQNQTNSNSKLGVLDEDSQSNSDSALDTGSGSDAETVSRISISSDDGELVTIEKLKNSDTNTVPSRNIESPVNGYRKVLFVCNL